MASFWSKLKAQLNPFDNGQTWDTVANNKRVGYRQFPQANQGTRGATQQPKVNVQALQQAMTQRKPAAGNSYLNSLKMGVRDIFDANTQADYIRRQAKSGLWESSNQQRDRLRKAEYERELKAAQAKKYRQDLPSKAVNTLTAGTGRGAVGIAQDLSGLVDLVTPGKGTSDFTKLMASKGKLWDEKAKLAGLNKGAYTVAQAPINIAAFASPGKVAKGIGVGQKGVKIGKTASVSPRVIAGAADVIADTLQNAGNRTSKGQDNSAQTAAKKQKKSEEDKTKDKRSGLSKAWDTVNFLDSGRSWTTNKPSAEQAKKGVLTQLSEGVGSTYTRVGEATGETINQFVNGDKQQRDFQQGQDVLQSVIDRATERLKDKNLPADKRKQFEKLRAETIKSRDKLYGQRSQRLDEVIERTDPVKGAAAIGSIGFDIATLGTGGAAAQAGKQTAKQVAKRVAVGAAQGAVSGGLSAVEQQGKDTSLMDVAKGAGLGATVGGGLVAGGKLASKGAKKVVKGVDKVARKKGFKPPTNLTPDELGDLLGFRREVGTGSMLDDGLYERGVAAAKKAGVDYRDNGQIDNVLSAHQDYEIRKASKTSPFKLTNEYGGSNADFDSPTIRNDLTGEVIPNPAYRGAVDSSASYRNPVIPAPEPSASSLRGSDLTTSQNGLQQTGRPRQTEPYPVLKDQGTLSPNNTTKTTEVKLNTDRLNPDGGYRALTELDQSTKETIARMSNNDIKKVAKDAGIDTRTFSDDQIRLKIAEQLNVRQDAVRLMNEADIARQNGDLATAEQLMLAASERGRISRSQGTDLARQLQARRIIANQLDTPQQRIFKLLDSLGINPEAYVKRLSTVDFNDPKQVVDAYRDLVPAKGKDWLDVVRYNSMLSSPLTHAVNMASNAVNVGVVAPLEKTLRGVADATGGLFGKERKYAAGEGGAYLSGVAKNIHKAATDFMDVMRSAQPIGNLDLADKSIPLATKGVAGAVDKTLSFPMKMLGASDKFFRALAEGGEENALKLRQRKGIKIKGNIDALKEAEGSYRLFQQDTDLKGQGAILQSIDSVTNLLLKLRSDHLWAKLVFPFVKTPTNILKQGIEFSPLGAVNALGAEDKLTALTRAAVGTGVFGMAGAMIGAGDMTWGEPRNTEEKNRFRSEGKQPYSVRIGGKWISFQKLPPALSFPLALTAGVHDAVKNGKLSEDDGSRIFEAVAKYGQFLSDQSYLKSVGDAMAAFEGDPEKTVRAVSNYPQQFIPFRALSGWIARMTDDIERRIDTTGNEIEKQVQSLMQQYPGLRQKTPTRDYKGEPIPANNPVLNAFTPFKVTDDRGVDPLDAEMDALKLATAKDPLLNEKQTKEVDRLVESQLSTMQRQLLNTQEYKNLTPSERKSRLNKIASDLRVVAKQKYMAENNIGEFSPSYTGKQTKLTKDQKALANGSFNLSSYTKPTKEAGTKTTYAEKYQSLLEESQDPNNGWSNVQKTVKAKELKKLGIQKDYDEDTVSLYGMSKADMYDYITSSNDGKKLADKLIAYDNALFDAGLIKSKKFKTGLAPSKGGRRGGKKGGRRKTAKLKARVPKLATIRVSRPKDVKIKNFKKPSLKVAKISTKSRGKKVKVKAMTG